MSDSRRDRALQGWFPSLVPLVQWLSDCLSRAVARGPGRRSAAVLRLLAVSDREGIPPARLLAAWARDERGGQATRVKQAAELLAAGATPGEVVKRVPGLVTLDHAAAVCCGERLGILPEVVSVTLAADEADDDGAWRRARAGLGYLAVVLLVLACVTSLLQIKVIPEYRHVIRDFGMEEPAALRLAASPWFFVPATIAVFPFLVAGAILRSIVAGTAPWAAVAVITGLVFLAWFAGRAVVRRVGGALATLFLRCRRRAAALDHLGAAVAAGRSFPGAAALLAECQVDHAVAASLRRLAAGGSSADLAGAGLATAAEQRFVEASGAAGAEAWGLHALARGQRERQGRRALAWSGTVVPVVTVLVMGAVVLLEALAIFEPIVRLIEALA